jgi:hypothetical protein
MPFLPHGTSRNRRAGPIPPQSPSGIGCCFPGGCAGGGLPPFAPTPHKGLGRSGRRHRAVRSRRSVYYRVKCFFRRQERYCQGVSGTMPDTLRARGGLRCHPGSPREKVAGQGLASVIQQALSHPLRPRLHGNRFGMSTPSIRMSIIVPFRDGLSAGGFPGSQCWRIAGSKTKTPWTRRTSPTFPWKVSDHGRDHPIHPVNLSRGHGSDIQDVSGRGSPRASDTVSHPSGSSIVLTLPLRAIQRSSRRASQAVASSSVVRASRTTYSRTSSPSDAERRRADDVQMKRHPANQ